MLREEAFGLLVMHMRCLSSLVVIVQLLPDVDTSCEEAGWQVMHRRNVYQSRWQCPAVGTATFIRNRVDGVKQLSGVILARRVGTPRMAATTVFSAW